jgi:hypothetical protein
VNTNLKELPYDLENQKIMLIGKREKTGLAKQRKWPLPSSLGQEL